MKLSHSYMCNFVISQQLKPVNSNEYGRRSSRSGSMVNLPDHNSIVNNVPVGTLCLLDDVDEHTILTATAIDDSYTIRMSASNSSSSFDTPPDTLPPVPPRIMKHKKHSQLDTSLTSSVAPLPLATLTQPSPMSFESNFVHSDSLKIASKTIASMRTTPPLLLPPPLKNLSAANNGSPESEVRACVSCVLFHSTLCSLASNFVVLFFAFYKISNVFGEATRFSFYSLIKNCITKTLISLSQDVSDNLIQLDSANTSFELDDFDPLNKNAKQIPKPAKPLPVPIGQSVFTAVPIRLSAFSNPVYPFHVPAQPSLTAATTKIDEDVELLRKYGLDRFHLNDSSNQKYFRCNSSLDSSSSSSALGNNNGMNRSTDPFYAPINGNVNSQLNHVNGSGHSIASKKDPWTTFD